MTRRPYVLFAVLFLLTPTPGLRAQSTSGSISGRATDPSRARIAEAKIAAVKAGTNARYETTTNGTGEYFLPSLPPGRYRIEVEKDGFRNLLKPDVIIHVQDALAIDFEMQVGSASNSITVEAGAPLLNTNDATVSTLVDNRFVDNMPLNGRSFGSLIDLTPGVVLTPTNLNEQGQFSVNGQRPDANYFMVDGVSANFGGAGAGSPLAQGGAGQLSATNAFGGMSNLVSLDALQEFRIQTSTFAPEFGRTPGAQVSVVTKSGTNSFHGAAFEYFRNDVLDANDWFANNKDLNKPALRQNDFGGVIGGPIKKNKLFFFGSYEGLRVRQPHVANTNVPSLATRQSAAPAVQPLLNAFSLPNGPDLGNGTAGFSASYSDPSTLNAYSARIDYLLSPTLTIFGRYSDAPSHLDQRGAQGFSYNIVQAIKYRTQTLTLGSNQSITSTLANEIRFNYSKNRIHTFVTLDDFGGGVPPADSVLFPYPSIATRDNSGFLFYAGGALVFITGAIANNPENQFNLTDNISKIIGSHQMKFGMDYRRVRSTAGFAPYTVQYLFSSVPNAVNNNLPATLIVSRTADLQMIFSNWSLFAQDTWRLTPKLTMTYGLRWEYNATPSSPNGTLPFTVNQVNDFSTMTLAPAGTPLWHPEKDDFAPRLGLAWQAFPNLVIRAGAGFFYDLGYSTVANGLNFFPYGQQKFVFGKSFPLSAADATPAPFTTNPPVSSLAVVDPNHVLPRTYEWNVAVERSLGKSDVLSLTYVGAGGRKLMRQDHYNKPNPNFTGEFDLMSNTATSNYNALQAQYRHRVSHGLQALVSYTWSHSIDDASSDANFSTVPAKIMSTSTERGPSDFDVRQTFSGAVSYDIPGPGSGVLKQIFGSWSTDSIVYARSAPPVNVVTGNSPFPTTSLSGARSVQRPDVVPGVPFYLYPSSAPGGKVINPAAFTTPVPATAQGNLGRNALRGFSATQWDITVRRQFRFTERFSLQFRGDFFNILNHPNFGNPINYMTSPQFGQSTQMLNNYLGGGGQSGGLNPLYQVGGPRSIQLALKLQF